MKLQPKLMFWFCACPSHTRITFSNFGPTFRNSNNYDITYLILMPKIQDYQSPIVFMKLHTAFGVKCIRISRASYELCLTG